MPQSSVYYTDLSLPSLNEDGSTCGTILNQYLEDLTGKLKALSDRINAAGVGTDSTLAQINRDINSVDTINSQLPAGCPDIFPDPYSGVYTTVSTWPAFNTELTALGLNPPETEAEILAFFTGDPSPMDELKNFFDTRIATINSTLDTAETNIARALRDTCKTNAVLESFNNRVYVKKYVRQSLPVPASTPSYGTLDPWYNNFTSALVDNPHEILFMQFLHYRTHPTLGAAYFFPNSLPARGTSYEVDLVHAAEIAFGTAAEYQSVNDALIANYVANGYINTGSTNTYIGYQHNTGGYRGENSNGDTFADYPVDSSISVGTDAYVIEVVTENEGSTSFQAASTPNGPPFQLLQDLSFSYVQANEDSGVTNFKTFGTLVGPSRGAGNNASVSTSNFQFRIIKYTVENVAVYDEPDFSSCPTAD